MLMKQKAIKTHTYKDALFVLESVNSKINLLI